MQGQQQRGQQGQQGQQANDMAFTGRASPSQSLQDSIAHKRRQVVELERKIETHRETGAYERVFSPGSEPIFDKPAMDEDIVRIGRLNREINDLERQQQRAEIQGNERLAQAKQMASQLARRELPSVDEDIRAEVSSSFVMLFNSMASQGEFNKAIYANQQNVTALLSQMWENAWGNAVRRKRTGAAGGQQGSSGGLNDQSQMPAASGLDGSDVPRPPQEQTRDEDPYTNNVMYAYERTRQRKSMTYAEAKAAEREAERQKLLGQQSQPQQGQGHRQ